MDLFSRIAPEFDIIVISEDFFNVQVIEKILVKLFLVYKPSSAFK